MRALLRALAVAAALSGPAAALAQAPDIDAVIDAAMERAAADDMDGAYQALAEGLRAARAADGLSPDWGVVFAIMVDMVRNHKQNPAYALMLADEGLAVLAPNAAEAADAVGVLNTSRSYALADLGRYDEAAALGRLTEPALRAAMGDEIADDYLAEVRSWEAGQSTEAGVSPMMLAERSRQAAEEALDRGDYAAALTQAAQAALPEGTRLDPAEVRANNADALRLTGRALFQLGRIAEARQTLALAVALVFEPGWDSGGEPVWRVDAGTQARMAGDLMVWLAKAEIGASGGDPAAIEAALLALDLAGRLVQRPADQFTVSYMRVNALARLDRTDQARAELAETAAAARQAGNADHELLAEYYIASLDAALAPTFEAVDTAALIAATDAALAGATPDTILDPVFLRSETAVLLLGTEATDRALVYVRDALAERLDRMAALGGAGMGDDALRQTTRSMVETLLQAAHDVASHEPGAFCPDEPGRGCVIIVENP